MYGRRWSTDVPSDLLREISGRFHVAADFVRFHAVCKPWRDSHSSAKPTSRTNQFLPWLLAPNKDTESIKIRCVFAKKSYRAPSSGHRRNWVANADGTAVRYFTADPDSGLHDPLTGGHTLPLPPLPHIGDWSDQMKNPAGIVYGDGTILLFSESPDDRWFRAALLRPGDSAWTLIERNLPYEYPGLFYVMYHGGKIMVTVESSVWHVVATNGDLKGDMLVPRLWLPDEDDDYFYHRSYALETRGELLWVSVEIHLDYPEVCKSLVGALRVFVLALEKVTEGPEKLRWVRKDARSLTDRVLFLGWPNSFAMEASARLCGDGGCAYFVYKDNEDLPHDPFGLFRYNLIDEKAELVEWLPNGWPEELCTWLVPQLSIAPIQEIHERSLDAPKRKKQQEEQSAPVTPISIIHIDRPQQPFFRVLVRNLPLSVNNSQLQHFFSKHGKVSNAEIIYYKKTKASQGIGFITMSTVHDQQADALAALNRLVFDGCKLEVSLVKKRQQRHRTAGSSTGVARHNDRRLSYHIFS